MTQIASSEATTLISDLPDELLEVIASYLAPLDTLTFGSTCRRHSKIAFESLVWRRHCVQGWKYWKPSHEIEEKLLAPPAQTKWRRLCIQRTRVDQEALELFDAMLLTQQYRLERIEKIASNGYDVKDLLLRLRDATPDDAEDVLARRYYANAILGQIHRATALEKWTRLQTRQMVRLEEVLGAYDLFVLSGKMGDLNDLDREFDRLAGCVKEQDPDFDDLTIRKKAERVARFLRSEGLVGNPNVEDFHALRNNFLSMALFDEVHTSLPLQSVAIYCAVARRLGIIARPSNYPQHVHAVIEAPANVTLDGKPNTPIPGEECEAEMMHMDPWRSSEEVPRQDLTLRLTQMGSPPHQHAQHLGPATTLEIAIRSGRNIMTSVQEARVRRRRGSRRSVFPDVECAWYSMLWSMLVLGDYNAVATLHRRRQCLPYLMEHFQNHFPEDLGLIEHHVPRMFADEREHVILMHAVTHARAEDRNKKPPSPRRNNCAAQLILYKVGHHFAHRRFGYEGIIIGWDIRCGADQHWMEQMRIDDLPRGKDQPFYHVVADDKSRRYVAEENIIVTEKGQGLQAQPCDALMALAGRYFKRWDMEENIFVSNIRDEYPDD